jgi:hypothetical protein
MAFRIEVDTGDLERLATEAGKKSARAVLLELKGRYQASFNKRVWDWPRETARGGSFRRDGTRTKGKVVGSPRNIIDKGELRKSLRFTFIDAFTAEYRWTASYATAVHQGARLRNGTLLPARPWTGAVRGTTPRPGIDVYPMADRLARVWLQTLEAS